MVRITGNVIIIFFCLSLELISSLALTEDGCVYSCGWGADGQTGLGHYETISRFSKVKGDISTEKIVKLNSRCDFVLALNGNIHSFFLTIKSNYFIFLCR